MPPFFRAIWIWITLGVWASACAAGFWGLWAYANTPGTAGTPSPGWVAPPALHPDEERPTLIVFAHPRCPCTRATMGALERLQRDAPGVFATRVVYYEPAGADVSWRRTDLWARGRALPDAETMADPGGVIAAEAGAAVSGTVALIGRDGSLEFWGGVTPARGHEGTSHGSIALLTILRAHEPEHRRTRVYGCPLNAPGAETGACHEGDACDAPSHG